MLFTPLMDNQIIDPHNVSHQQDHDEHPAEEQASGYSGIRFILQGNDFLPGPFTDVGLYFFVYVCLMPGINPWPWFLQFRLHFLLLLRSQPTDSLYTGLCAHA
jgi:hypothetical protein